MLQPATGDEGLAGHSAGAFVPYDLIDGDYAAGLILLCDHARNNLPGEYGTLGLPPGEFERHIAYDIGVAAVTLQVARRLGIPAVMSRFSRLLIDPNRGLDDPTLIMALSDGEVVPGNRQIDDDERARRIACYYRPYHDAIAAAIDRGRAATARDGRQPSLLSIHSFTPVWKGVPRPWHAGVLWARDDRFARPLIRALEDIGGLCVGNNEPYSGGLSGDTLDTHADQCGLASALIEIRQDLVAGGRGIDIWTNHLTGILSDLFNLNDMKGQGGNPS